MAWQVAPNFANGGRDATGGARQRTVCLQQRWSNSFGDSGASGSKSFRLDHPDDPANKYLLHYAAESPEVINLHRGTTVLDDNGAATCVRDRRRRDRWLRPLRGRDSK